jgi:hypothetical protein
LKMSGKSPLGMRRSYRRACALEEVLENLLWACADPIEGCALLEDVLENLLWASADPVGGRALLKMSWKISFGHAQIAVTTRHIFRSAN